jgi:hypothetical protein
MVEEPLDRVGSREAKTLVIIKSNFMKIFMGE